MLNHEKCLGEVGRPSADLTGKDGGQRNWSRGDSLALQTGLYCGQVTTEPPDLASIF